MIRDIGVYLDDILESIKQIEKYTKGLTQKDFEHKLQVQDAVIRRFEIIGEAVKNIPEDYKKSHPEIEWRKAAAIRNILIHEYFEVNIERVWNTIIDDLPLFKKQIQGLPKISKI